MFNSALVLNIGTVVSSKVSVISVNDHMVLDNKKFCDMSGWTEKVKTIIPVTPLTPKGLQNKLGQQRYL